MAQIVKLRRSSVSGQKPTNTNLQLGELALNTTDGKVYMAKSGSLGPSVEELISTNTVNTGSIYVTDNVTASYFTGSFIGDGSGLTNIPYSGVTGLELNKITSGSVSASISPDRGLEINTDTTITGSLTITGSTTQIGNNTLLGTTLLSGSITISGSLDPSTPSVRIYGDLQTDGVIKFDPVSKNIDNSISASYLFVSSSTNDLYFSQNGNGYNNVTRLRWLEGNMYTGLLHGGNITATNGGTTFNVSKGSGIIVNLNASLTDDPYPTTKLIEWGDFTGQTLTYRTTHIQTFIGINDDGEIHQQTGAFNDGQYNSIITLGTVIHQNLSTVNASITYPNVAYGYKQRTYDFFKAFGALKLSGLDMIPTGSLGLNVGSGTAWADGRNYQNDPNNPSYIIDPGTAVSKIFRYYQVSGTTFVQDTNNGAGYTEIDPTKYVNNGVLTSVGGDYTIQRVFWYPNSATKGIVVYYGNDTYGTIREAIDNIAIERFIEIENTKQNAIYLGSIIIAGNGDFTNTNKYSLVPAGLFRNVGGNGGGGSIPTSRLVDLSDVDVVSTQDNDLLVYNVDTLKWESTKSLEGDYTITGSLNVTGGLTGSLDFSNITNTPTLVSGSSQIEITGTTGYSTFSGSISTSIGELSSSVATTTNDLDGRLDSIEGVTGSYATTGSNHFKDDQTITGSLNVLTKVVTDELHVSGNVYFGTGDSTDRIVIKSFFSTSIIPDSDGDHYIGQPLKRWANIYSSTGSFNNLMGNSGSVINIFDAVVTGSFTGSFNGDGSGLYNIPSSGVTGIELNKINSGSVSASISPDRGFEINTDVYIDGTITAKEIHIDYVTSSVLYQSGSTKFGDTSDDNHIFTGSVYIDGTLNVDSITGSIDFSNLTNTPTLVSGSSQISYTGITDIPSGIVSGSSQILDGSGIVSSSTQISFTGVTDVPTLVSGSSQISYTGITDIPSGLVSGSSQVVDLGFLITSSFETFTSSYTTHSSSFDTRINEITGSITDIDSAIDSLQLYTGALNNFTSSFILDTQTSSMTVLSSSFALTASYALNGGGGGTEGRTARLDQTTPNTTWTFGHNLGEQYPAITIFDSDDNVVIPSSINAQDSNTLIITFPIAQSGTATATVGGGIPFISSSFNGYVLSANDSAPSWKGGMISGSLQITNLGFSTTGSNTFTDNQTIEGTLTISTALVQQTTTTGVTTNTVIAQFPTGSYDSGFFDYVIKDGTNLRAGTVTSVWTSSDIIFNEVTTNDLGDTTDVNMVVGLSGGNAKLTANVSSGNWTIKVLSRGL